MSIQKYLQSELHKITREVNQYGENYVFWRDDVDKYGEPTGTTRNIADVKGLFHTERSYVSKNASDATTTHATGTPMILARYDDAKDIKLADWLTINGKTFKVVDVNDVMEYNIVVNISLDEVVADDRN